MATLSELAEVIAKVEGIDQATVTWVGRSLREAGLVAKRGRGPSAAQMGWSDATNMLIAVNATRNTADAVRAVSAYRLFRPDPVQFQTEWTRDFILGEAMEQLLVAAGSGELPRPFLGTIDKLELAEAFATGEVHVELRFRTNAPSVFLRVTQDVQVAPGFNHSMTELRATLPAWLSVHFSPRKVRGPPKAGGGSGDRLEETTIGFRTLSAVGKLICSHAS